MGKPSADPAVMDWTWQEGKRNADAVTRLYLRSHLADVRTSARCPLEVLSFPAHSWIWECDLAESFPAHHLQFSGVEQNEIVHRSMALRVGKLQKYPRVSARFCSRPESLLSWLKSGQDGDVRSYDIVYLDWMGTWNFSKQEEVSHLLQHELLNEGGFLVMTYCMSRGSPRMIASLSKGHAPRWTRSLQDFRGNEGEDLRIHPKVTGVSRWLRRTSRDAGVDLVPVSLVAYQSLRSGVTPNTELQMITRHGGYL